MFCNEILLNFKTRCCLDWDEKKILRLSFQKSMLELQILKERFLGVEPVVFVYEQELKEAYLLVAFNDE